MPSEYRQHSSADVQECMDLLRGLEASRSGASKGRAIIEHLLEMSAAREDSGKDEAVPPFLVDYGGMGWVQLPGSGLFGYEAVGTDLFAVWQQMRMWIRNET